MLALQRSTLAQQGRGGGAYSQEGAPASQQGFLGGFPWVFLWGTRRLLLAGCQNRVPSLCHKGHWGFSHT